jgi:O-antigen/teichoic acid export membrane protein
LQTYLSFAVLFSVFGFNTSVVKLCSEDRRGGELRYLFNKSLCYVAITSALACLIAVCLNYADLISSDKEIQYYFYILVIGIVPQAFESIFTCYLQARRLIKQYSKINVAVKFVSVIGIIICTWKLGMPGYIGMYLGGFFISFFALATYIKKHSKEAIIPIEQPFKLHFKLAYIALLTNILGLTFNYFDVFLMNYLVTDRESIGFYSFALTLTLGMTIYRNTVNQIAVPYLSNMSRELDVLQQKAQSYGRINVFASLCLAILFIVAVPILVKIVYKEKFDNSMVFFFILCLSEMFYSISSFKGYTILAIGEIKYNFYGSLISGLLGLLFSLIGLKFFGLTGLATGKLVSNLLFCVIVIFIYKRALRHYNNSILPLFNK